jgi:hypothetical protein
MPNGRPHFVFSGGRFAKYAGGGRYIEYQLPPNSIAEIMIGSDAPRDAEADVAQMLNDYGWPGVSVTRSLREP